MTRRLYTWNCRTPGTADQLAVRRVAGSQRPQVSASPNLGALAGRLMDDRRTGGFPHRVGQRHQVILARTQ